VNRLKKYTVLVACGTGMVTSAIVCNRVEKLIEDNKVNAAIVQCKVAEVVSRQESADLIVATITLPTTYSIPTLNATAYITGIGVAELDQQILSHLKE
jgi:PTS system galactitol-specific IIB component